MVTRESNEKGQSSELSASQEVMRMLVDSVDEYAIFALDPQGNILTWNRGGEKLKGYSRDEIVGTNFSRFYTKVDIDRNHPANELVLAAKNGKYEEEGWRVRKDGTPFWANVVITALRDEKGVLQGFGKVTRDLTQKKMAEKLLRESEERFRLIVESVQDYAIFMLSPSGYITTWNKGAERSKGYKAGEIIGKHFSIFYTEEDIRAGKPDFELREAVRVGRFEDEGWRRRKNGSLFWANIIISPMYDGNGELLGFSKVTQDLTERKKSEDALRTAYAELEDRIGQRTKELSEAKARAEAAVKTRDNFFSMASHELKTPLSSLKLQIQLRKRNILRGNLSGFAPERLGELCTEDERQIERLTFLVDNMLDISKLTSGALKLSLETFPLNDVLKDVVARLAPILDNSENTCRIESAEEVTGTWDRHRLEQVFTNLLSNAGKYAPGKPVDIKIFRKGNSVVVSVQDYGRGISEKDQARIFNPYERVGDHGQTSGLGLGLYITRQIIEAHHGELKVTSRLGEGSVFTVALPLDSGRSRSDS